MCLESVLMVGSPPPGAPDFDGSVVGLVEQKKDELETSNSFYLLQLEASYQIQDSNVP